MLPALVLTKCETFISVTSSSSLMWPRVVQDRIPMSSWPAPRRKWRSGLNSLGESLAPPSGGKDPCRLFLNKLSVTSQRWEGSSFRHDLSWNSVQREPRGDNSEAMFICQGCSTLPPVISSPTLDWLERPFVCTHQQMYVMPWSGPFPLWTQCFCL